MCQQCTNYCTGQKHAPAVRPVVDGDARSARRPGRRTACRSAVCCRPGRRFCGQWRSPLWPCPRVRTQAAIECAESRIGPAQDGRGQLQQGRSPVCGPSRLRAQDPTARVFVEGGQRQPRAKVLASRPPKYARVVLTRPWSGPGEWQFMNNVDTVGWLPDLVTVTKLLPGHCYQFTDCNAFIFNSI